MTFQPVASSNMHSVAHDETGQHVRYHVTNCNKRLVPGNPVCNCEGGPVYQHAGVPVELHEQMLAAPSVASFHAKNIKAAKHPTTGALLYPGVKVEPKAAGV